VLPVSRYLETTARSLTCARPSRNLGDEPVQVTAPRPEEMVPTMADSGDRMRRPARAPVRAATRRRWLLAGGIGGLWLLLLVGTGSMILATVMLLLVMLLAGACVVGLRALGVDRDHPWVQRMAERPWRDGREVLEQGLRHLPELFLVTPSGSLLAPNAVELRMNPDDLASLTGMMDLELISSSAAEVYQGHIADSGARLGSDGPVEVRVVGDPVVPVGRYRIRQGRPVSAVPPAGAGPLVMASGAPFNAHDGYTQGEGSGDRAMVTDLQTAGEAPLVPPLMLVTNGSVMQTCLSGARAGRGSTAELLLPAEPTISRVHAKFVFSDHQWWITSLGRNGVTLNGVPVTAERPVRDGDAIGWGSGPEALMSRVRIG
jgi:FHA domain